MTNLWQTLSPYLIAELRQAVRDSLATAEEIRLRVGQPVVLKLSGKEGYITAAGTISADISSALIAEADMLERSLMLFSRSSFYALEEELRRGYITLSGGHRVGLCGRAILEGGRVRTLKDIGSINLRIAKEVRGAAKPLLPYVLSPDGDVFHTLIISPPRGGKTTLLRDLVRMMAEGEEGFSPVDVGLVDERSEIAACFEGAPQLDVGRRCDVLDACPKAEGMMMLLRSMAPQVIATDEIGTDADALAIEEALNGGVRVLATAHGASLAEVSARPALGQMLSQGFFQRIILIGRGSEGCRVLKAYDAQGESVRL